MSTMAATGTPRRTPRQSTDVFKAAAVDRTRSFSPRLRPRPGN